MIVPVPLGAVNATLTEETPNTVPLPIVGAPETVVFAVEALDATDVPPELVAVTVNV